MKKLISVLILTSVALCSCTVGNSIDEDSASVISESAADSSAAYDAASSATESSIDSTEESGKEISFSTSKGDERLGFSSVISKVESSVVAINVTGTATYYYYTYPTEGSGSGVIVSEDGYIVTNNHVVSGGDNITVFLSDGTSYPANLVASDSESDIAVLKIEAEGLVPAVMGESSTLRVGDYAIAIGNPLGEFQGSATLGIVSALNREIQVDGETRTMFQVDAAINPGNSGGGLFDSNGMLIGIVSAKTVSEEVEGLGFVLPIDNVKPVVQDLINFGYVKGRPTLGFEPVEITSMRVAQYYGLSRLGVYVNKVEEGSYAEQCGLQYKDYISSADGETVATVERLDEILNSKNVGDTLVLEIIRGDDVLDVVLVIGERVS